MNQRSDKIRAAEELTKKGLTSLPLTPELLADQEVAVVVTDHDGIDWAGIVEHAPLVVDLRNTVPDDPKVWRL